MDTYVGEPWEPRSRLEPQQGQLFNNKPTFNADIGKWNVASVSNMAGSQQSRYRRGHDPCDVSGPVRARLCWRRRRHVLRKETASPGTRTMNHDSEDAGSLKIC